MRRSVLSGAAFIMVVLLCGAPGLAARDFPLPIAMANPFLMSTDRPLFPGGHGDVAYHRYRFLKGDHDLFSIRQRASIALATTERFGAAMYYQNHLLVGPVRPGENPFSIAEWNMNAVQFEYGAIAGARTPAGDLTLEYGRTSQHPLRGMYSEVSSDIVEVAYYSPSLVWMGARADAGLRIAYVDMFDFWESPLLAPRTRFRLEIPVEIERPLGPGGLSAVLRVWPRLLFMRDEGVWPYAQTDPPVQAEIDAEAGVRFEGSSYAELLLEFYTTRDTEQLRREPGPLTTLGFVIRVGYASRCAHLPRYCIR